MRETVMEELRGHGGGECAAAFLMAHQSVRDFLLSLITREKGGHMGRGYHIHTDMIYIYIYI